MEVFSNCDGEGAAEEVCDEDEDEAGGGLDGADELEHADEQHELEAAQEVGGRDAARGAAAVGEGGGGRSSRRGPGGTR